MERVLRTPDMGRRPPRTGLSDNDFRPHRAQLPSRLPLLEQKVAPEPKTKKVSVILTSYNRPERVKRAIESVLHQTYENFEVIVVDDGSNKETVDSINSFNDSRVVKLLLERKELEGARYCHTINSGLEIATGDFITYLTDDDFYFPTRLEVMVAEFDDPRKWVVYGNQLETILDSEGKTISENLRECLGPVRDMSVISCRLDHNSFMHRAACLKSIPKPYWPSNSWSAGDIEFWKKVTQQWNLYPVRDFSVPLEKHHVSPDGIGSRVRAGKSPIYGEKKTTTRIAVVVAVNDDEKFQKNVILSPGLQEVNAHIVPCRGFNSAAEAFYWGLQQTEDPWIIYCHQDVYFPTGSGQAIAELLSEVCNETKTVLGFAGKEGDPSNSDPAGLVIDGKVVFDWPTNGLPASSIDELAVILHRNCKYRIDQELGWHLWATDLCLQARQDNGSARIMRIRPPVQHNKSVHHLWDFMPPEFYVSGDKLAKKYPAMGTVQTLCGPVPYRGAKC